VSWSPGRRDRGQSRKARSCCKPRRGKREGNAFRYTGGKAAIAGEIHDAICSCEQKLIGKVQPYLEPFAGAMSVAFKFALDVEDKCNDRSITICDANPDMTRLWTALKKGTLPPKYVNEAQYGSYKQSNSASRPMKGYVGSVFAFGGSMFGTYRGRVQSAAVTQKEGEGSYNKLMKVIPLLEHIDVKSSRSYDSFENLRGKTIYCDPPYETNSKFSNKFLSGFDHEHFWDVMRQWSKHNLVFISELSSNVPSDFKIVWSKIIKRSYNSKSGAKEKKEALCVHKSWF
jgi:site-specific DNA-adenine methylase